MTLEQLIELKQQELKLLKRKALREKKHQEFLLQADDELLAIRAIIAEIDLINPIIQPEPVSEPVVESVSTSAQAPVAADFADHEPPEAYPAYDFEADMRAAEEALAVEVAQEECIEAPVVDDVPVLEPAPMPEYTVKDLKSEVGSYFH